ncbi:FecR family protein [Fibrella aquatilis]|uniref:FecR domain-containing protein n=1 Tax=Fibrella aquatilis TaxID=2817059 RepID=A0A939GA13_9BACT|nr:FecR domain-containing protein [Fibrella aquatilis]MBO0933988.1 FecR domain-containing protein [Fibrella aquatilis]
MTEALLNRYFADKTTPEEARHVLDWFDTDAGQVYLNHRLDKQLGAPNWHAPPNAPTPDPDRLLAAIRQRAQPFSIDRTPSLRRWQPLRWAAAFLGTLLLASGAYVAYRQVYPADVLQQTAFGIIQTLTLPDGSTVTLNGNSRLRYSPHWESGQTRQVWLDGEGFFRVRHQKSHERFVVHLPNKLNIEVLGTQFNVMARESRARVVLSSGHIRLANASGQQLDMQPGELVETNGKAQHVSRRRVDPAVDASWQTTRLTFDNASLADMVQRLKDTYGLEVVVSDPALLTQRFSGSVPNNNVTMLTDGLARLFGLTIRRQGNTIFINATN